MNVPIELMQAIANYLTTRPYGEVYQLLNDMSELRADEVVPVVEPVEPVTPPEEGKEVKL
jgi:hypothetical protein